MSIPFLSQCSSVTTQNRLQYLLELQTRKETRVYGHSSREPDDSAPLSPIPFVTTEGCKDESPDETHATQPRSTGFRALRRLRQSKSTEGPRSTEGCEIQPEVSGADGKVVGKDASHLYKEYQGYPDISEQEEKYQFECKAESLIEQTSHEIVANGAPLEASANGLLPTTIWSRSTQNTRHGATEYGATSLLRHCSALFTNPFALEFFLDPIKLSYSSTLLCRAVCLQQKDLIPLSSKKINILDVGGELADSYIGTLNSNPQLYVVKAIIKQATHLSYPQHVDRTLASPIQSSAITNSAKVLLVDRPWSMPFATQSIDIVVARSLHKDFMPKMATGPPSTLVRTVCGDVLKSLREFHRILSAGGYMEYIYFERHLYNAGPLMEQLEPFFYERNWGSTDGHSVQNSGLESDRQATASSERQYFTPDTLARAKEDVTVEDFLSLVTVAGFETKQKTVMMFPVQVLSALFTREGQRRSITGSTRAICPIDRTVQDPKVSQLLKRIQSECTASNPAWRCVVGWAKKASPPSGN